MKLKIEVIIVAILPIIASGFVTSSGSITRPFALSPSSVLTRSETIIRRKLAEEDLDDDDDDDADSDFENPLSKGVDSVSWLPAAVGSRSSSGGNSLTQKDAEIIPLFPLGGIVYTPNSEHILNIFEPRYREMYSDILMNGSKKFVVSMSHPSEPGSFAQMGVLFELDDLKEVSEQTGDKIKFICSHKVTGRVKIHRIINPQDWETRSTYLRVEGTIYDDSGKNRTSDIYGALSEAVESDPKEEKALRDAFADLVDLQHSLEEDVRFTRASVASLATKPGSGESSLWQTVRLWHSFADQRLMARQNELQRDFQEKLQAFLKKEKGLKDNELPSAIGFQDLSAELQKEVQDLQKRMTVELQPLIFESTLSMQKILEAPDHTARLKLLRYFIEGEIRRLNTKKTLQSLFKGGSSSSLLSGMPAEELMDEAQSNASSFFEDDDAFQ